MPLERFPCPEKVFEEEFANRLRELRNQKSVSAREMSISLGQNVNYINLIENNKRMPSMQGFFLICEYLQITPRDFFNFGGKRGSEDGSQIVDDISALFEKHIQTLSVMLQKIKK